MGSYNIHCGLTGKNIFSGDIFYGIYLVETAFGDPKRDLAVNSFASRCYPVEFFQPMSVPYLMTHDGYGRFALENPNDPLFLEMKQELNISDDDLLGNINRPVTPLFAVSKEAFECAIRLLDEDPERKERTKQGYLTDLIPLTFRQLAHQFLSQETVDNVFKTSSTNQNMFDRSNPHIFYQHFQRYLTNRDEMFHYYYQLIAITVALNNVGRFYHATSYCSESADTTKYIKALALAIPNDFPIFEEDAG